MTIGAVGTSTDMERVAAAEPQALELSAPAIERGGDRPRPGQRLNIRRLIALAAVGLMVCLAALTVFDTARAVIRLRSPYPYIDEWDNIAAYQAWIEGRITILDAFLRPNYEHRIAFPRLILYSDYMVFGGRGTLDLLVIFATQALQAAILLGLAWSAPASLIGRIVIAAVVVGLTFSLRQWQNFVWGFQVPFVGVYAVASVGILLFVKALAVRDRGGRGTVPLAAAYAAAFVATFTMASGMLVGPVLVALALLWRAKWWIVALTTGVALMSAAAYKAGLEIQAGYTIVDALGRLRQPARLIAFTAIDLGNLQEHSILAARWLGYGAFAAAVVVGVDAVSQRKGSPTPVALAGIMLFCLASAMMTAVGRLGYGMEQALSSRYATGTSLFWSSVLAYAWHAAGGTTRPERWRAAIGTAGVLFLVCAAWTGRDNRASAESWSSLQNRAADLTLTGLNKGSTDPDDDSSPLQPLIEFMRARRLSVFSRPEGAFAGRRLADAGPVAAPTSCRGGIAAAAAIPEQGVAIRGFGNHQQSGRVYIADPEGMIVGFASYATDPARATGWEGFARASVGTRLSAYVLLPDGGLCKLGEAPVEAASPSSP